MMVSSKTSINVYLKEIFQWFQTEWVRNPGGIHLNQFHDCNTGNTGCDAGGCSGGGDCGGCDAGEGILVVLLIVLIILVIIGIIFITFILVVFVSVVLKRHLSILKNKTRTATYVVRDLSSISLPEESV